MPANVTMILAISTLASMLPLLLSEMWILVSSIAGTSYPHAIAKIKVMAHIGRLRISLSKQAAHVKAA